MDMAGLLQSPPPGVVAASAWTRADGGLYAMEIMAGTGRNNRKIIVRIAVLSILFSAQSA